MDRNNPNKNIHDSSVSRNHTSIKPIVEKSNRVEPETRNDDKNLSDTNYDSIYSHPLSNIPPFAFDEQVAQVFDDMALRSIPAYLSGLDLIQQILTTTLTKTLKKTDTPPRATAPRRVYDLGCSTGNLLRLLIDKSETPLELIGIDTSQPMLEICQKKLTGCAKAIERKPTTQENSHPPLHTDVIRTGKLHTWELHCQSIEDFDYQNCFAFIANYKLQFIDPSSRLALLKRCYHKLETNGLMIISEKTITGDDSLDDVIQTLYWNYKQANGYSQLEIAQKREALENVLRPLSINDNESLLKEAGFQNPVVLCKWLNFTTFLARKAGSSGE